MAYIGCSFKKGNHDNRIKKPLRRRVKNWEFWLLQNKDPYCSPQKLIKTGLENSNWIDFYGCFTFDPFAHFWQISICVCAKNADITKTRNLLEILFSRSIEEANRTFSPRTHNVDFKFWAMGYRSPQFSMLFRLGPITFSTGIEFPFFSQISLVLVDFYNYFSVSTIFFRFSTIYPNFSAFMLRATLLPPGFCCFYPSGYL